MALIRVKRYENRKISVEHFCTQAFTFLKEIVSDNYVKHKCSDDKGCELRVVVLDGNEKNHRRMCLKEYIVENSSKLYYYKMCINNPDFGHHS